MALTLLYYNVYKPSSFTTPTINPPLSTPAQAIANTSIFSSPEQIHLRAPPRERNALPLQVNSPNSLHPLKPIQQDKTMASQGYYNQGGPQYPQQSYGPPQGYNQGYGPPQGYNQGPPMQYQQGPPQQVVVKQKKDRGCLTAW